MTPRNIFHGQICQKYYKIIQRKVLAFYKSLNNFLISLVTHCKKHYNYLVNIIAYLSDLEILLSVEYLKIRKYLSFSCKIEDL